MKIKSIRSKVMASIILITFLTAIAIAIVFYEKSGQMIEQNYVTVLQQKNRLLADTVDDMLKEVCYVNINASCDDKIEEAVGKYVQSGDEKELENIAGQLRVYEKQNTSISSMYLLIPQKSQIVTSLNYPVYRSQIKSETMERYMQATQNDSGPVILDDIIHTGEKVLSFMETVKDENGQVIAYICANIEESKLSYDYFDNAEDETLKRLVLLNEGQIVASRKLSQMGETLADHQTLEQWIGGNDVTGGDKEYIYIFSRGTFSGCGIFAQAEKKVILSDLLQMRKYILGIVALFIFLSLIPAAYITKVVYKPVKKLTGAMKKVSKGEMDTRVEIVSQDEIGMMSHEFNGMLDQIEQLIQQVILEEEMKNDAELEALQYQITPHFMYNTLNSIKCYALIKGEKEIAGVIEDFVELLQTCISKRGAFLTVSEEVHILQNYLRLQEFRNGEKLQVDYEIQPEAQQCLVPRLILQPLVENALIHGLDIKRKQGRLVIRAWMKDNTLHMEVQDNGRGMSPEQIKELLTSKVKKTKGLTAVGVPNVRERLKLNYKEKAGLSYESSGEGTTAMIYLPEVRD